jgi:hypothetical protein
VRRVGRQAGMTESTRVPGMKPSCRRGDPALLAEQSQKKILVRVAVKRLTRAKSDADRLTCLEMQMERSDSPNPLFCVSRGNKGVAGIRSVSRGNKGVSGILLERGN